jgi:hypothetical protein
MCIGFAVYGAVKDEMLQMQWKCFRDPDSGRINSMGSMLSGAISGMNDRERYCGI